MGVAPVLSALRIRDFRLLWAARLVSAMGQWLLVIAIPAHVYAMTGSLVATGLTLFAEFLPPLVLGPLAGVVGDRFDRRRIMIATDLLRAGAIALLLLARDPSMLWLVYAALMVESTGTVLFRPALQAHLPAVLGTGKLLTGANSLNATTDGVVRLVGASLGAVLLTAVGADVLICLDVSGYLLSTLFVLLTGKRTAPRERTPTTVAAIVGELRAGLGFVRADRTAWSLLLVNAVFLAANASLTALLVPFGITHLGGNEPTGVVMSALGVGFLLGALLIKLLLDRVQPGRLTAAALVLTSTGYVALFLSSSLGTAVPAAVVVGVFGSMCLVVPMTTLQRVTPNRILSRVMGVFFTGEALATLIGSLLGPVLAGTAGLLPALMTACALTSIAGVLSFLLVPRMSAVPTPVGA